MSGRGRFTPSSRGSYRGGRGSGRGSGRSGRSSSSFNSNNKSTTKTTSSNNKNEEIKFAPYYTGKQQMVTYDTVREHVIQQIQKNFKCGSDMVKSIRDGAYGAIGGGKPVRQLTALRNPADNSVKDEMVVKIEQDGYDLEYTEDLRNYNMRMKRTSTKRTHLYLGIATK